ncbi:MAG TPA: hypothetical protein VF591_28955 [Pyrinomonadaceae bacterium]|jgi:hypothetical protein
MREPQQQTSSVADEATIVVGGEETTLVAPRFDDEETLVARPVMPLEDDVTEAAPELPAVAALPPTARGYRRPFAPRRSWTLALVLVSVLIGGVLGGAGLYLYQRQSHDPAVSPAAMTQPAAPADAAQAPPAEVRNTTPPESTAPQAAAPTGAASNAEEPAPPARDAEASAAAPAREPENVPAAERRTAPSDGTPKRGKKGERDAEIERRDTPQPGGNVARAEAPQARQVDTIFYRQRRAERQAERRAARRARRDDDVDRLRRIFEGTPE